MDSARAPENSKFPDEIGSGSCARRRTHVLPGPHQAGHTGIVHRSQSVPSLSEGVSRPAIHPP